MPYADPPLPEWAARLATGLGLNRTKTAILLALLAAGGSARIDSLAAATGFHRVTLNRYLRELWTAGYVTPDQTIRPGARATWVVDPPALHCDLQALRDATESAEVTTHRGSPTSLGQNGPVITESGGAPRDPDIEPDTKDWTWVLQRPCPECGYVASSMDPLAVGGAVRATLPRWQLALARPDAARRPRPDVWSALEYGAHVRDVFRVFDVRLASMLEPDDPLFANWDQDATAVQEGYAGQDPAIVATELVTAGEVIAARFDSLTEDQLTRPGRRSDGAAFTVDTFARYFLHDVLHHLHDVKA